MGIGQVVSALKALSGEKKQYLEGIVVTDIFPKDIDSFTSNLPRKTKDMRSMMSDPNNMLRLTSLTDNARRAIKNKYLNFNKYFQTESKKVEKDWITIEKTVKLRESVERDFNEVKKKLSVVENQVEPAKKEMESIRISSSSGSSGDLKALKEQFTEGKLDKARKINDKIAEVKKKINDAVEEQRAGAQEILENYATFKKLSEEKKAKLLSGKYTWGPTFSKEATKAESAYMFLYNLEKWKKEKFSNDLDFLKNPEKYDKSDFKDFHKELEQMDKDLRKLQEKMNEIQQKQEKATQLSKQVEEFGKEGSIFSQYIKLSDEYRTDVVKLLNALKKENENYRLVVNNAERISNSAEKFLNDSNVNTDLESRVQKFKKGDFGSLPASGEIPLILAVAKVYYFFNSLSAICETAIRELNSKEGRLKSELAVQNEKAIRRNKSQPLEK